MNVYVKLTGSDVRAAPLPGNDPRWRSRAEPGLEPVHRLTSPANRLVASILGLG